MKRYLLCLLLSLVIAASIEPRVSYTTPLNQNSAVNVVFVIPENETLSAEEKELGVAAVRSAVDYWSRWKQLEVNESVSAVSSVTAYESIQWVDPFLSNSNYTYFFVDNSNTRNMFVGGYAGISFYQMHLGGNVLYTPMMESVVKHEFGHMLFNLPDLGPCSNDIMCDFGRNMVSFPGCQTLQLLETPCLKVYLPAIL